MFYQIVRMIGYLLVHLFWSIEIKGEDSIKQEGPLILAANHVSYLDPIVLGISVKRQIFFITKKEIFEVPFLGLILKSLDAIPVGRNRVNISSMKKSISLLKSGHILGIFPEGTRSLNGNLLEFNTGMIKIALKTGSPIVPVGINGTYEIYPPQARIPNIFKRTMITISFDKPIYLDKNREKEVKYHKESLLRVQDKIKELTRKPADTINNK